MRGRAFKHACSHTFGPLDVNLDALPMSLTLYSKRLWSFKSISEVMRHSSFSLNHHRLALSAVCDKPRDCTESPATSKPPSTHLCVTSSGVHLLIPSIQPCHDSTVASKPCLQSLPYQASISTHTFMCTLTHTHTQANRNLKSTRGQPVSAF